ncbi:MAG: hypothetical protein CFE21_12445 [Bacteroidetes bacterium B1(2017)]|nr:MAG: hypothetical protein CFE21_12445 [Bacteroidetes bacterium B1(2017)]
MPATTGGEISTLQILTYMGKVNRLKVFTVEPYKDVSHQKFDFELLFGMKFKPWRYLNPFLLFKVIKLIKEHKSDAIFFDQPFMGWMIPFIRISTGKKVFLRSNNIEYLRFKSMGKSWWSLLYMYEKFVYRMASLVIFVSDVDQNKAIKEFDLNPENTLLTPYGIPQNSLPIPVANARQQLLQRHVIGSNQHILLFFSTLNYQPNYEAVTFIANEILPILKRTRTGDFCILICGKNLPKDIQESLTDKPEIKYLGFVEDIETYIDGASVMLNPILSGGGVKTKAIDTLGRGQVVISTKTGAEGIDPSVCGNNLRIAENGNWEEYANLVNQQLDSPTNNLPQAFFETYSWSGIIANLMTKLNASNK